MSKLYLLAVFLLIGMPANAATNLFSDGFESGNFSNWASSAAPWEVHGTTAHGGVKRAETTVAGDGSLNKTISTINYQNISLSYWWQLKDKLEADDHVTVAWSVDGTDWTQLADYTGSATISFEQANYALPASAEDQPSLQFRFRAVVNSGSDKFWLDDVSVTGPAKSPPTPPPNTTPAPPPDQTPAPSAYPYTDTTPAR